MSAEKPRALILAAGQGRRMRSSVPKVLLPLAGRPLIAHILEALRPLTDEIAVVVSPANNAEIKERLGERLHYIVQREARGTGHAVRAAEPWLRGFEGALLVMVGDAPFISTDILARLCTMRDRGDHAVVFLSVLFPHKPPPWGRVVRAADGRVLRIVEEKDASEEEKRIREVSSSHYCFDTSRLLQALPALRADNVQGEYYLPDVIAGFVRQGYTAEALSTGDTMLPFGVNTPEDMRLAEELLQKRSRK